jgi:penicillin-binding protein 2
MSKEFVRQERIILVLGLLVTILVCQAAYLQIFDRSLSRRASNTAIDRMTVYPSRGLIFDRKSRLMVNNFATYDLMVTIQQMDPKMDTTKFCDLLGITKTDFKEFLNKDFKSGKFSPFNPFAFLKKLPTKTYARLQESLYEFPGFFVQIRNIRGYPYPNGAQLLGYIGDASPDDLKKDPVHYEMGDYLGVSGIESRYEEYLRGVKGISLQLKDNRGRAVGKYRDGEQDSMAVSGKDLITGIDMELQAYGEALMANKSGSVVAIEPATGEVLCMITSPTYDPNLLTMTSARGKIYAALANDKVAKPLLDRSVQARYPPGSIFKPLVALVGLQEGTINPESGRGCGGGYYYAGRLYKCHGHAGVGNVRDAVAYSCNTYFFQEFRAIVDKYGFKNNEQGLDMFNKYATQFGLGAKTGLDQGNELAGNIPTTAYYNKIYPRNLGHWKSPTIMSVGIGQGELQLTTIQMANLAACIANRGHWISPHIAKEFRDKTPLPQTHHQRHDVSIDRQHFETVIDGMEGCVQRGTASIAKIEGISVCGKTGTSQNVHGEDHSVFFAFAPKENPKIAIAVFVENAGFGATFAAPIASLMIEKYLKDTIPAARMHIEKRMKETNLLEKIYAGKLRDSLVTLITSGPIPIDLPEPMPVPKPERVPLDVPSGRLPGVIEPQIPTVEKPRDSIQ